MKTLKEKIFDLVKKREHISFAELQNNFNINNGDFALEARANSNIFYWIGLSEESVNTIEELLAEKKIFVHPSSELTYVIDGAMPQMEICKSNRNYKTPHWMPITFCTYPIETKSKPKKKSFKTLPRMKFREDMQAWEIHYLSPNKAKRMNSITVSLADFAKDKAELIANFLNYRASKLEDDPSIPKGNKSGTRITEDCQNDIIMRDAKKAVIEFLSNF